MVGLLAEKAQAVQRKETRLRMGVRNVLDQDLQAGMLAEELKTAKERLQEETKGKCPVCGGKWDG